MRSLEEYAASDHSNSPRGGSKLRHTPYAADALNYAAAHPATLASARRWIGSADIAVGREMLWANDGVRIDFDQELNVDYCGNRWWFQSSGLASGTLSAIVYYTDVLADSDAAP